MYATILLLGFLLTCFCGIFYILKWRRAKYLGHLPTLHYLPLAGNMHYLLGGAKSAFKLLVHASNVMEKTNSPFVFWFGIKPLIAIIDPNDAKRIFSEFPEKPYIYSFAKEYVGNGLITAPGYIWKQNIKKLAGIFTREVVNGYQDTFNTQVRKLVEKLKLLSDCEPFNIMDLLAYTTFESVCQAAFGVPEISNSIMTEEYYQAYTNITKSLIERLLNIFLHPQCIYKRTKAYKKYMEHVEVVNKVPEMVLKKCKQEQLQPRTVQSSNHDFDSTRPRSKTLLNILLEMSESFTEEQIKSEINTIVAAAQETAATTLFFALLVIGSKKDIQEKLYNEMKEIFGDSKRDVLQEDLERMVYCEGVIYETLRLYPPAPLVVRNIEYDFDLQSCTLPKDAMCALNIWGAGRSKRIWGEDVLEFLPERWSVPAPPILAFSTGKRICIGKKYAMSFIKTSLAHLIRDFVFTSDITKMKFQFDITLRLCEGNLMQVHLRDRV